MSTQTPGRRGNSTSDSVGLERDLGSYISSELLGDDALGPCVEQQEF